MKKLMIAIVLIIATANVIAQKCFTVLDATTQSWTGGMQQNGYGTTYTVKLVLKTDRKITFTDIWIGKDYGLPEVSSYSYSDGRALKKDDTVLVKYTIHHYPANSPMAQMNNPIIKPVPVYVRKGELIGYTVGEIKKYYVVKEFTELPAQKNL